MSITKIAALASTAIMALSLLGCSGGDDTRTLVIGYQDNGLPKLVEASGVLKGAPYKVRWAILSGPAANLSALYSKKIDIGHMGDTSLIVEQSNAAQTWAADSIPLKIVAGWRRAPDPNYPQIVTAVRTSSKIKSPADLRGHTWAYNFGGYNHAQYLASLARAKLTEADIKPIKFGDSNSAAAAFTAGETDVYSGGLGPILTALDSGEAKILLSDTDTGIPALSVWTARTDVLKDSTKDNNLKDFFARMSGYWTWHARHLGQVKQTLKDVLKQSDRRAEWEAGNRQARYYRLDQELVTKEQKVADVLFQGRGIKKEVNVTFEYDPRYNDAQKAVSVDGRR